MHRRLTAAGIAHVAMKGAYLAYHAFPEPGLRPLRDLDILVPADRAVEAYELLRASGVQTRLDSLTREPALVMAINHHLPGFRLAGSGTWVELHHQIFPNRGGVDLRFAQGNSAAPPGDPALDPAFRARCIVRDLAGAPISYMAPTDLLHHVIVHAVYAHEFNTGPLFLADIAWLLDSHAIDWPLFWRLVETRRQERGAELALRMMEIYWGPRRIDWSGAPCVGGDIPTAVAEAAAQLSLRELDTSSLLSLLQYIRDTPRLGGRVRLVLRRLFPDRLTLAATYAPGGARPLLTTLYIRHSRRLVGRSIFAYQTMARSSTAGQDLNALASVRDWLRGKTSANALLAKVANTPNPP